MTRKQALLYAIEHIGEDNIEAVAQLESMYDDMPMCHWSEAACKDAIEQFYIDRGRYPNVSDLDRFAYLPSHTAVQNRFGVPAREFLAQYTGAAKQVSKEKAMDEFVSEYNRIRPTSSLMYNRERGEGVITWQFVAHLCGVNTWLELLRLANLERIKKEPKPTVYKIISHGGILDTERKIRERTIQRAETDGILEELFGSTEKYKKYVEERELVIEHKVPDYYLRVNGKLIEGYEE